MGSPSELPFLEVEKNFAKKIEERTNGKVKIDITFAGGLGKGNELMPLAAAAPSTCVYRRATTRTLFFIRAFQIPFVFDDPQEAMTLSRNSFAELPMFNAEMDKFNVKFCSTSRSVSTT